MTDITETHDIFFSVDGNLVKPTAMMQTLLEVAARHDPAVAESFAQRFPFRDEADFWNIDDVAHALGMDVRTLHTEFKAEAHKRFGETLN